METDYRQLEIEMLCANDLANTSYLSKMDVYIVSSVSSDRRSIERTPVDKNGGTNPSWPKFKMRFNVDESAARLNSTNLVFQIISRRILGDRTIGFVRVPLKALLDQQDLQEYNQEKCENSIHLRGISASRQLTTLGGKTKGTLCFEYSFGERFKVPYKPEQGYDYESQIPISYHSGIGPDHQNVRALPAHPQQSHPVEYPGRDPIVSVRQKKRRSCFGLGLVCEWGAKFLKALFSPLWLRHQIKIP